MQSTSAQAHPEAEVVEGAEADHPVVLLQSMLAQLSFLQADQLPLMAETEVTVETVPREVRAVATAEAVAEVEVVPEETAASSF